MYDEDDLKEILLSYDWQVKEGQTEDYDLLDNDSKLVTNSNQCPNRKFGSHYYYYQGIARKEKETEAWSLCNTLNQAGNKCLL
ncbi:hypothetical protein KIN20_026395 [Parelaphostrongylus tenuis]|uniref:Uncharacterized protein n=1 Tax=Parelaphostrongylus tenuis TaxID=148309 RepID=A0AAD5QY04_PARTN|nr:hypothetical protein KIN20_026395 [Parelaphostrongylus tenuis]